MMINQGLNSGKKDLDRVWAYSHFKPLNQGKSRAEATQKVRGK